MARTDIVKSVDTKTKLAIYKSFIKKEEKTKKSLAKKYGVSTRTLGRILNEMTKADEVVEVDVSWDYCTTKNEITIFRNEESRTINKSFPDFWNIKTDLIQEQFSDEVLSQAYDKMCLKTVIETFSEGNLTVNHELGKIFYGTFEVKNSLVTQIMKLLDKGQPVTFMVKFLDKLMDNPDKHIIDQLYPFMKHNDISINEEGNIIAYRAVNKKFKDYHTGTMDNSVGSVVKMPRNLVDCNPEVTCSTGIHCAALEYAQMFSRGDDPIVEVEVNPSHVCSVPVDYEGQKMRVCELKVVKVYNND